MIRKRYRIGGLLLAASLIAMGCGGDDDGDATASPTTTAAAQDGGDGNGGDTESTLSGEITLVTIRNTTGAVGPFDSRVLEGQQFAVDEINASGMLGDATLRLDVIDPASDVQQAVDAVTRVAASDAPLAFSPVFSTQVLSMAPIAQNEGLPFIVVNAGVPGVVETGDHIFRVTPPQDTLVHLVSECIADAGMSKVAMIYQDFNATLAGLAEDTYPALFDEAGIESTSEGYPQGTTDFSAVVSRVLSSDPDAVGVLVSGADIPSLITQLERQGFEGQIFGQAGWGPADLEPVTDAAEGIVLAASFSPEAEAPSTQEFAAAWAEAHDGAAPESLNAEGYDSVYLAANALLEAGGLDRDAIQQALLDLTDQGYEGALGNVTFEERDARNDGSLIEWIDGGLHLSDGCG